MKRIIAVVLCVMFIFSMTGCTTIVTKTFTRKPGQTDNSSSSSSSENSNSSKEENTSSTPESNTSSETGGNTDSSEDRKEADSTVDEVKKNTAVFNGAYADESGYTLYYVDQKSGDDSNSGRSPKSPWKTLDNVNMGDFAPGTKILLKRGSIFNETLLPSSSGIPGKYIIIDAYGTGAKPVINGNGESAAVTLTNVQYIEVRNLQITNKSDDVSARNGVYVQSGGNKSATTYYDGGYKSHIYLINLDISDVSCPEGKRFSAGIIFYSKLSKNPAAFKDVLVQGCTIQRTGAAGITMASDYANGPGVEWSAGPYFPSQNVCFRGNYISDVASDGIFQSAANNVLIEYNTVVKTSYAQGAYAGIWPHRSTNVVMQYNEAYDTKLVGGDGQGFDVDIDCVNTVVQYNYSHDNEGGFILLCTDGTNNGFNQDITVRYNISQNDMGQIFTLSGPISDVKIYNNTVYTKEGLNTRLVGSYDWAAGKSPADARFTNNIFYMNTKGNNSLIIPSRIVFNNNLFWGSYNYSNLPAINTIVADPKFTAVNTGSIGRDTASGYSLKAGSPCIDTGVKLSSSGNRDFFGNSVPSNGRTDIGAVEYTGSK